MNAIFGEGPDPNKHVTYENLSIVGSIVGVPLIVTAYEMPNLTLLFLLSDDSNSIINLLIHLYLLNFKIVSACHWQLLLL